MFITGQMRDTKGMLRGNSSSFFIFKSKSNRLFVFICVIMLLGGVIVIDIKEMAKELNVHPNTVAGLVKKGMPSYKIGKARRFDKEEVFKWIKENYKEGK